MALLDKKKLLAKEELEIVKVQLNKDDFVFVRQMTGRERDRWEQSLRTKIRNDKGEVTGGEINLDDFRAKLAVNTVCDDKGTLLLEPSDYAALSQNKSAKTLETIINVAQKLNKISEKDKENLVKNSDAAPSGGSISGSAKN